jgi:hypothetical protein
MWKSKEVVGHSLEYYNDKIFDSNNKLLQVISKPQNSMILYYENGSLERIANWNDYDMKLKTDWILATKKQIENEIGQDVKINL